MTPIREALQACQTNIAELEKARAQTVAELILLLRRAEEEWSERTRKEVFAASERLGRFEEDRRSVAAASLRDVLSRMR